MNSEDSRHETITELQALVCDVETGVCLPDTAATAGSGQLTGKFLLSVPTPAEGGEE